MSLTLLKSMGTFVCELSAAAFVLAWLRPPFPEQVFERQRQLRQPLADHRDRRKAKEREQIKQEMAWMRTHYPRHYAAQVAELTRRGYEVDDSSLEVRNRGMQWPPAVQARAEAEARAAQYKDGGDPDAALDWSDVEVAMHKERLRVLRQQRDERIAWRRAHPDEKRDDDDDDDEEDDEEDEESNEVLSSAVSKLKPPSGWTPSLRSQPSSNDRAPVVQGRGAPAGRQQRAPDTEDEFSDASGFGTDNDD